eukprot:scaffold2981_cov154-Ochromonas_danica.AAC.5
MIDVPAACLLLPPATQADTTTFNSTLESFAANETLHSSISLLWNRKAPMSSTNKVKVFLGTSAVLTFAYLSFFGLKSPMEKKGPSMFDMHKPEAVIKAMEESAK